MEHVCEHNHAAQSLDTYKRVVWIGSIALFIQVILVVMSGSVALLSDTIHLASDTLFFIGSLVVVWKASTMTNKKGSWWRTIAAYTGIALLVCGAYEVNEEASRHLAHHVSVANGWMLAGGVIGFTANALMYRTLHAPPPSQFKILARVGPVRWDREIQPSPQCHHHVHDHVVSAHVLTDLGGSVLVIISAGLSLVHDVGSIDAYLAKGLAIFMVGLSVYLLAKTMNGESIH